MDSPLLKTLTPSSDFSDDDRRLLNELTSERQKHDGAREDITWEGEHSDDIHVVATGSICRYKHLENGSRQLMAFLVPGDPCDQIFILDTMDLTIGALTPSVVASVSGTRMKKLLPSSGSTCPTRWDITPVSVNRMLKQLREENPIAIEGKTWTVLNPEGLRDVANDETSVLHLDRARREPDSEVGKRIKGLI